MRSKFHERNCALITGPDVKCHRNACVDTLFIGDTLGTDLFLESFIVTRTPRSQKMKEAKYTKILFSIVYFSQIIFLSCYRPPSSMCRVPSGQSGFYTISCHLQLLINDVFLLLPHKHCFAIHFLKLILFLSICHVPSAR